MKKKLLSLALALAMCLALFPAPAAALSDGTFEYTISDDGVNITKLLDTSIEHLTIPSSIAGKPVVSIAGMNGGGWENESLKSAVVPSSVKTIEQWCFSSCPNLTSVTLSEGLEAIHSEAFNSSGITSITLPESVKTLGGTGYQGNGVFGECGSLTSVKLPSGLTKIPNRCFSSCDSLKTVEIPSSVTEIGEHAFGYSGIVSLKLPKGVKVLPEEMCIECKQLRQVDLPAGLEEIGWSTFKGCSSLESILLPTSLKTIGISAFFSSGLKEIILPYGVENCYPECFDDCSALTAIYAPSTLDEIGTAAPTSFKPLVYCMPDSKVKADCEKRGISCLSDASCDTRINVLYNGKRVSFGAYGQNPEIVNSRTMVPLRSIFEAMGADVQWDAATKTVTAARGSNKIVMTLGQAGYQVNGVSKTMDTPPMLLNSRTMVPVRVVAESFGADVTWHAASATVLIAE